MWQILTPIETVKLKPGQQYAHKLIGSENLIINKQGAGFTVKATECAGILPKQYRDNNEW